MNTCWGERKFQREQVGVVIAIYQDNFDLPHAPVTTFQIHWIDQHGLQSIIMCTCMPRCSNGTTPKYEQSKRMCPLKTSWDASLVVVCWCSVCLPTHPDALAKVKQTQKNSGTSFLSFFSFPMSENGLKGAVLRKSKGICLVGLHLKHCKTKLECRV